jgi:mono/diheme cytochrome c family protein
MRPLTLVLPLVLAALVAGTFVVALNVMREDPRDPAPAAPAATTATAEAMAQRPPAQTAERTAPEPSGPRAVFAHTCGACHTLADAGASGLFGPDLDELRPSAARVRRMIRTGSLDGIMQPGLLEGDEARSVATYVARVAGRR